MGITATATEMKKMELAILYEFISEHPDIKQTAANGTALKMYLVENDLPVSWKGLSAAYNALKASGKLELALTPEQAEEQRAEQVRLQIFTEANQRLAPAKVDFTNQATLAKVYRWLHKNANGRMTTELVLQALNALRLEIPFIVEKSFDKDVDGRHNYAADGERHDRMDSAERGIVQGKRNHAVKDNSVDRESSERVRKFKASLKADENEKLERAIDSAISSYVAVRNGRISQSQSEEIRELLKRYADKYGPAVLALIQSMPDDERTARYILDRMDRDVSVSSFDTDKIQSHGW